MIHAIEKPPNEYHCPEMVDSWHSEWTLNENTKSCYLFRQGYAAYDMQSSYLILEFTATIYPFYSRQKIEDDSSLWLTHPETQQYCAKHGSNMVSILSFEENSWVAARLFRQRFELFSRLFFSIDKIKNIVKVSHGLE